MHPLRLYDISIEPPFGDELEIVLPGRNFEHAKRAAEILLLTRGDAAFDRAEISMSRDLAKIYARKADTLIQHLLHAYDAVYHTAQKRRFMAELFDHIEYQLDAAYPYSRNLDHALLERYIVQRAARQLPDQVTEAARLKRQPHNANTPSAAIPSPRLNAAKRLISAIEKDAHETAALTAQVKREHIEARIAISRAARARITAVRSRVNQDFRQHYRQVAHLKHEKNQSPDRYDAADHRATLKAVTGSHQRVLRQALKPIHDHKRDALAKADTLLLDFHNRNARLATWETDWLRQQWRDISATHFRDKHAAARPDAAPARNAQPFMERLAVRARQRAAPAPSNDHSTDHDPEPS